MEKLRLSKYVSEKEWGFDITKLRFYCFILAIKWTKIINTFRFNSDNLNPPRQFWLNSDDWFVRRTHHGGKFMIIQIANTLELNKVR